MLRTLVHVVLARFRAATRPLCGSYEEAARRSTPAGYDADDLVRVVAAKTIALREALETDEGGASTGST